MTGISLNLPKLVIDAVAASAGIESSHFALPGRTTTLTWQTFFGTAPASCTFKLWGSLDNSHYSVIDTGTAVAGEVRTVNTNVSSIYVELDAVSGGADVSVLVVPKDL